MQESGLHWVMRVGELTTYLADCNTRKSGPVLCLGSRVELPLVARGVGTGELSQGHEMKRVGWLDQL